MLSNRKVLLILIIVLAYLILAGMQKPDIITEKDSLVTGNLLFKYEVNKYPSSVEVVAFEPGENIPLGMDTSPDNLNFGVIPYDSISSRFVNLTNLQNIDAKISFMATGIIEPFVNFEKNGFILKSNEKISTMLYFNSTGVEPGNYSGYIYVIMEMPRYAIF